MTFVSVMNLLWWDLTAGSEALLILLESVNSTIYYCNLWSACEDWRFINGAIPS